MKNNIIKDFFRWALFIKEYNNILPYKIRRVKKKAAGPNKKENSGTINKIIILVSWFMVLSASFSFVVLVIFGFYEKEAPPEISQVLTATLGYLGGVFSSFLRLKNPEG